jgi:4'-phosphopantetheinyl transferase
MSVVLWLGTVAHAQASANAAGHEWLSGTERARLAAFTAPRRRAQFLAGRWAVRQLLASAHGGDALADWSLDAAPQAPPRLVRGLRALHVAISHSGNHVACAASAEPVGLDIEAPWRQRDITALAEGVCTATERARLLLLPAAERAGHFYRVWTLKEAWLKRRGEGVSPARLVSLQATMAPGPEAAEGRVWQQDGLTLALLVPAALPVQWHGTRLVAPGEGGPEYWCVQDRGDTHAQQRYSAAASSPAWSHRR